MIEFRVMHFCRNSALFLFIALFTWAHVSLTCLQMSYAQEILVAEEETEIENGIEAKDVIIELPETIPESAPRGFYTGGVPLILVLPFYATGGQPETQSALSYGIAARLVDDFYPIGAVRTIPIDRLAKSFPSILSPAPAEAGKELVDTIFASINANYAITGIANLQGANIDITVTMYVPEGHAAAVFSVKGELSKLPAILSGLSFEILTAARVALTDTDRKYLEYVEPYSVDVWLKCQYGLSVATAVLAGEKVDKKMIASAKRSLGEALKTSPEYLRAREALGVIEFTTGDLKAAESTFREIVTRNPNYGPARFYLGAILLKAGNANSARKELTLATELNKNDALAWLFLGRAHLADGQPMMAEQAIRRSLDLDPTSSEAFFALGMTLLEQGSNLLAAEAFGEVVMRRPELAQAQYNLALALFRANEFELAARHFRNYIGLTPGDEFGDHMEIESWIAEIETVLRRSEVSSSAVEVQ